ncbi:unnamed protein product [Caenorhabditis bovis]|uniref:PDZ domain-containing protein n=1 Tax=Caenorhabditis bovis TaxID=2654633 RepID=A0A8S1EYQ1_9PELO|nr:unnamed protein product [Caenorhabditis bovis]
MPFQSEEERIREVLRDLKSRKEGGDVKEDIERIERILKDPLFKQLSNQKLIICSFDAKPVELIILETKEKQPRLLIVGPKDVKTRSSGKLRIGDSVLAIDAPCAAAATKPSPARTTNDNQGAPSSGAAEAAATASSLPNAPISKQNFDSTYSLAASRGQHLVVALIREATPMVLSGDWTQVEVIRLNTETGGLGFGIVGGTSTGVVVKTILPGSPADKDGRLQPGDHILQIGNINTHGMSSQQVATILRHQHPVVEMIVGRPIAYADKPADTPECFTLATKAALCATTLEEAIQRQMATSAPSTAAIQTPNTMSPSVSCTPIEEEKEPEPEASRKISAAPTSTSSPPPPPPPLKKTSYDPQQIDIRKPCECAPHYNRRECVHSSSEHNHVSPTTSPDKEESMSIKAETAEMTSSKGSPTNDQNGKGTTTSSSSRMSLKSLQEMALTVFLRENWDNAKFEIIEVVLQRDPALGLGITVAGYVHKKEEIGGIFVKSLVPRSAASASGVIKVHDLILEVNGVSLEHMSHADSVRTLVKSGDKVNLKLVRFPPNSSQAQCLKMLQQQETETQVIDVKLSNPNLVHEWKSRLVDDVDIISAVVKPDRQMQDGGLGISLEGTVDVLNGAQLCPHHYIESIRENGPVAKTGLLQAGDELLQVNHSPLYGESHVTVRQALTRAVHSGAPVTLIVARRSQQLHLFEPTSCEKQLPLAFPFLAANQETVVKAKSEIDLSSTRAETTQLLQKVSRRLRSRSLENFHGLAVWNCVPLVIYLNKDHRGLGFSIVDYKDPTHSHESVIVVQSLVPGGVAQIDGRIVPGDRLLFVNNHDLSNSSLERAVAVLKAARMGPVRLGIAKPIPVEQQSQFTTSHSPLCSRSERLLARGRSPRGRRRYQSGTTSSQETVWIGTAEQYRRLHPQAYYPSRSPSTARSERSLDGSEFSMTSWSPCSTRSVSPCGSPISLRGSWAYDVVFLPSHLERTIKLQKGPLPLGIVLDADKDKGVNGCVVKSICGKKAVALDGRLQVGDYVVKINTESLRNVTSSQARAILKRENLIGAGCTITYITSADAKTWKERFQKPPETSSPIVNRLSPKVFPKFYRSPYLNRQESLSKNQETDDETEAEAPSIMTDSMSDAIRIKEVEKDNFEGEERRRLGRLIDGIEIDDFVNSLIKEAIADASVELGAIAKIEGKVEEELSKKHIEKVVDESAPPPVQKVEPLLRRDSEPSNSRPNREYIQGQRQSQLHILSTEEEVEKTIQIETDLPVAQEVPRISPSAIKLDDDNEDVDAQIGSNGGTTETTAQREESPSISQKLVEKTGEADEPPCASSEARPVANSSSTPSIVKNSPPPPPPASVPSTSSTSQNSTETTTTTTTTTMSKATSRTPSTGSESIQQQARQLARSKYWGEARTVVLNREPNKSFGISIVGGRVEVSQKGGLPGTGNTVCGIFIKSVLPNSPAGRSGQMNMGDRVISVNDIDLRDATHEQAVNAIKNATNPVRFVLQSLHTNQQNMHNSASNSTVGSVRFENDVNQQPPVQITPLKPMMVVTQAPTTSTAQTPTSTSASVDSESKADSSTSCSSPDIQRENTVKRMKNEDSQEQSTSSAPAPVEAPLSSNPKRQPSVKEGEEEQEDRVTRPLLPPPPTPPKKQMSVEKQTSVESRKSVKSVKKSLIKKSSSNESAPLIVSDVSSSETHDEIELPPSTSNENIYRVLGIEENSAARLPVGDGETPTKFQYTKSKVNTKYGHDGGQVVIVQCEKPEAGLGISLAGNKDRDKQNVFVVNVRAACPLEIRPGDELLEINGRVLQNISHVTASAVIRECCDLHPTIEIVIRRKEGALNECAVRNEANVTPTPQQEATTSSSPPPPADDDQNQLEQQKDLVSIFINYNDGVIVG